MSYCKHLTNRQLNNVYWDEKVRIKRTNAEGDVGLAACQMLLDVQIEASRRPGFEFDKSARDRKFECFECGYETYRSEARQTRCDDCLANLEQDYLQPKWNHTWSLAVEEHFYLLLPSLLAGLLWFRRGSADPFRPLVVVVGATGLVLLLARVGNS